MARFRSAIAVSTAALSLALAIAGQAFADEPKAAIRGELPDALRASIVLAIGVSHDRAGSRLEARRRANDAAADAKAVLESSGYYGHHVEPTVDDAGQPVVVIDPGPRFTIAAPLVTWRDPAPPPAVQAAGEAAMGLKEGEPASNGAVVAAEGRIVAAVRQLGYADARAAPLTAEENWKAIADHDSQTLIPDFRIEAGPLVHLGTIDLQTEGRTNPAWVQRLVPWQPGDVYNPEDVAELERRLLDARVYQSITVALAPIDAANPQGPRKVVVSLADQPRGVLEVGAGWSTTEGVGLDMRFQRFNKLGRADTQTYLFRYARIQKLLDAEISLPHWRSPDHTLRLGAGAYANNTDAFDDRGVNMRADITRHYGKTSFFTYGGAIDYGQIDEQFPVVRTRDIGTLTGLAILTWDRSNDPLNPKRGWKLDGRVEPTFSAMGGSNIYLRVQAQGSAYLPLGEGAHTVLAGRLKLGSVIGAGLFDIPSSRRLYSGGGGSVRGYAYQGVGPRFPDDLPQGGLGLFEASLEARHDFTERWGGVLFADVGSIASASTPDFSNTSAGVGFGVRYNLGFGPVRADIAVPLNRRTGDPAYQIYLSVGQSF